MDKKLQRTVYAIFSKSKKGWIRKEGSISPTFAHARLFSGNGHARNSTPYRRDLRLGDNDLLIIPVNIEVDEKDLFMRVLSNKTT